MRSRPLRYPQRVEADRRVPPELPPETPELLRPVIDLANSRPIGELPEALTDPRAADAYLEASGLDLGGRPLGQAGLARLLELRATIVQLLDPETDDASRDAAWRALDAFAADAPVTLTFGPGATTGLRPAATGLEGVVSRVLAEIQRAVVSGQWARVRLCAFAPCGAAFYDATRSRTQRWHSYRVCGNRVNVARHRERVQGTTA